MKSYQFFRRTAVLFLTLLPMMTVPVVAQTVGGQGPAATPAMSAAPLPNATTLQLRTGQIVLDRAASLATTGGGFDAALRYVMQLDGPITPDRRAALEALGVRLGEYLPVNAWVVRLGGISVEAVAELSFVGWVGPFNSDWKLCPNIGRVTLETSERRDLAAAGRRVLTVALFDDADVADTAEALRSCGAAVRHVADLAPQMEIEIGEESIACLRDMADVMFVEEVPEGAPRNSTTTWICQSNVSGSTPLWDAGLHGEGQMANIIDWALRDAHCAFADAEGDPFGSLHRKIEAYYGYPPSSQTYAYHGTHVSSVMVGDDPAQSNVNLRGLAYMSRFVFQHYSAVITDTSLNDRLTIGNSHGAHVHNLSWGSSARDYIAWARDIDLFTRNNEEDLVLVAITNSPVQVQAPENAKNCLAVASTQDTPNQGSHCIGGYGPTTDGRQKPEVFATGCGSIAADPLPCGTNSGGGTSYAAPAAGAMALLVRQYFMEGFYPSGAATPADAMTPSGALLKAMLINSAVDMTGMAGYYTVNEGWGRILVDDPLYFTGETRRLVVHDVWNVSGLSTGQADSRYVTVPSAAAPLKITVVWTDPPAALLAAHTPVNNLDLRVTDPDGLIYLGNVFSGLESATGGSADSLNNVEQVHRLAPTAGIWQVEVIGTAVNQGPQGYALVVTGSAWDGIVCLKGDVNHDGLVNGGDIAAFVNVLLSGGTLWDACAADMNGNDGPDVDDVPDFVNALLTAE